MDQSIFRLTNSQTANFRPRTTKGRTRLVSRSTGNKNQLFDVSPLKQTISELSQTNRRLKSTIKHLQGALVSQQQRDLLYKDFEADLNEDVISLEQRLKKLDELTKDVNKFSSPTRQIYQPKFVDQEESVRTKATQEHKRLTQQALFNERKIVLMKMQLKLCHDRRDLVALRDNLNVFEGGGRTMTQDKELEETIKIQIQNIRMKQIHEKERIEHEKSPNIVLHDAATCIQSAWRGYKCRMEIKAQIEKEHQEMQQKAAKKAKKKPKNPQ